MSVSNKDLYYLNNTKKIIFYDANIVYIKSSLSTYTLKGSGISALVKDILKEFDSGNDIQTVKECLGYKYTLKSIEKILNLLVEKNILSTTNYNQKSNNLKFLSDFSVNLDTLNDIKNSYKISVIASGSMINDILSTINDSQFIKDIYIINLDTDECIIDEYLKYNNLSINIVPYDVNKFNMIYNAMNLSHFTIVALDELDGSLLSNVNNISIELEKPWIKTVINGCSGEIGPLFIPSETSCYECYKLRSLDNLSTDNSIIFNDVFNDVQALNMGYLSSFLKINIGFMLTEFLKYLLNINCELKNNMMTINYLDFSISKHPIIKVHNCKCNI